MANSGILKTDTVLDKIIAHKQGEVALAENRIPITELTMVCQNAPPLQNFIGGLKKDPSKVALIAEVKKASPSKGVMIDPFHPVEIAQMYAQHGASAISVLTDERFFQGHLDYLKAIRKKVHWPLLRKDFIIRPYQVYEARAAGADAVLLIVAVLDDSLLHDLHGMIDGFGMAALVEVHDEQEMERALKISPKLIGINNRDLRDFSVDLSTTSRLGKMAPVDVVLVGESGVKTAEDVRAMGVVDAILVGETVVTATDRIGKLKELTSIKRTSRR